jgi:hypothetical protein
MLETFLIQKVVIYNVELFQLGSSSGNLNKATGSEVMAVDNVEPPQFWKKFGQLCG